MCSDTLVAQHMQAWTASQFARLRGSAALRQPELFLPQPDPQPADAWEQAIAQARAEIRTLVEDGDIGHEDVPKLWVAQRTEARRVGKGCVSPFRSRGWPCT